MSSFFKKITLGILVCFFLLPSSTFAQGAVNATIQQPTKEAVQARTDLTQAQKDSRSTGLYTQAQAKAAQDQLDISCGFNPWTWPACFTAKLSAFVLKMASNLLYMSAKAFDWSINYSLNIVKIMTDMPIVTVGWKILLNITNIAYIFILLFVAICMILGLSTYGNKALIARIILTAIFVNFSLFATKLVIDVANIGALQFYNLMNPAGSSSSSQTDQPSALSEQFMGPLGLTKIFGDTSGSITTPGAGFSGNDNTSVVSLSSVDANTLSGGGGQAGYWKIALLSLFGSIFIVTTAFVFLAGAFLFISRTLVLLFLMMFSSFAFAANVLPKTKDHFTNWSSKLIKNAIFAPIFIGLLYILITALKASNLGAGISFSQMILNGQFTNGFVNFFMVQGAIVGILLISVKTGVMGGEAAGGMVNKRFGLKALGGYGKNIGLGAGKMAYGAGRAVAVRTGGSLATKLSENTLIKSASRFIPGASRLLAKVGDATGYNDLRKRREKHMGEKYDYLATTSPQRRWETDEKYKTRQDKAKVRALASVGLNKDGSRRIGMVGQTFIGDQLSRVLLGGQSYKKLRSAKAKEAKAGYKAKEVKKKTKMATLLGLETLTNLPLSRDENGEIVPDNNKVYALHQILEAKTQTSIRRGIAHDGSPTWFVDMPPAPDTEQSIYSSDLNDAIDSTRDDPTLTPAENMHAKMTSKRFKQEMKEILAKATSMKNILDKEAEDSGK